MTKLKQDDVYRAIDLVFDSNLDAALARMAEDVKKTFADNKFRHATLVLDVRNPSKEKMFP